MFTKILTRNIFIFNKNQIIIKEIDTMKKKLCTIMLALVLAFSIITPTFAAAESTVTDTSVLDKKISVLEKRDQESSG